jgi:hypothetical protein
LGRRFAATFRFFVISDRVSPGLGGPHQLASGNMSRWSVRAWCRLPGEQGGSAGCPRQNHLALLAARGASNKEERVRVRKLRHDGFALAHRPAERIWEFSSLTITDEDKLIYAGYIGTCMTWREMAELRASSPSRLRG